MAIAEFLRLLADGASGIFAPRVPAGHRARRATKAVIAEGIERSDKVLAALEKLAAGGPFLVGRPLSLADLHLGAMVACFTAAPEGQEALGSPRPAVRMVACIFSSRLSLRETDPGLPSG